MRERHDEGRVAVAAARGAPVRDRGVRAPAPPRRPRLPVRAHPHALRLAGAAVGGPGRGADGTASARDRGAVEQLGAVAIDYRNEDFLARVRGLPGKGVDVVLDGLGGALSVRSFRALRSGGRLVVFGYSSALTQGRRSRIAWIKWNAQTASVFLRGLLSPRRRVRGYPIRKLPHPRPAG